MFDCGFQFNDRLFRAPGSLQSKCMRCPNRNLPRHHNHLNNTAITYLLTRFNIQLACPIFLFPLVKHHSPLIPPSGEIE